MKSLIEQARTCHGEHTTHGKFIQDLADYAEAAKRDAEEAEAYAASLESDMTALADMLRKSKERNDDLESKLTMSDLMDRFKAAADALADAVTHEREMVCQDIAMQIAASDAVEAALTEYRAARAAIETPQAKDQPHD
jgi:hypothetical protein